MTKNYMWTAPSCCTRPLALLLRTTALLVGGFLPSGNKVSGTGVVPGGRRSSPHRPPLSALATSTGRTKKGSISNGRRGREDHGTTSKNSSTRTPSANSLGSRSTSAGSSGSDRRPNGTNSGRTSKSASATRTRTLVPATASSPPAQKMKNQYDLDDKNGDVALLQDIELRALKEWYVAAQHESDTITPKTRAALEREFELLVFSPVYKRIMPPRELQAKREKLSAVQLPDEEARRAKQAREDPAPAASTTSFEGSLCPRKSITLILADVNRATWAGQFATKEDFRRIFLVNNSSGEHAQKEPCLAPLYKDLIKFILLAACSKWHDSSWLGGQEGLHMKEQSGSQSLRSEDEMLNGEREMNSTTLLEDALDTLNLSTDTSNAIGPVVGFASQGDVYVAETVVWEAFLAEADRVRKEDAQIDGRRGARDEKKDLAEAGISPATAVLLQLFTRHPLLDRTAPLLDGAVEKYLHWAVGDIMDNKTKGTTATRGDYSGASTSWSSSREQSTIVPAGAAQQLVGLPLVLKHFGEKLAAHGPQPIQKWRDLLWSKLPNDYRKRMPSIFQAFFDTTDVENSDLALQTIWELQWRHVCQTQWLATVRPDLLIRSGLWDQLLQHTRETQNPVLVSIALTLSLAGWYKVGVGGTINEVRGPTKEAFQRLTQRDLSKVKKALETYVTSLRTSIGTPHRQELFLNQLRGGIFEARQQALRLVVLARVEGAQDSLPGGAAQELSLLREQQAERAKEAAWTVRNAFVQQIESMFAAVAPSTWKQRLGNMVRGRGDSSTTRNVLPNYANATPPSSSTRGQHGTTPSAQSRHQDPCEDRGFFSIFSSRSCRRRNPAPVSGPPSSAISYTAVPGAGETAPEA
ncbi:unnamed protein product [Amoebophrya sp. A120]|nr:unnamed protein product [Amoebophrya sp. A120]|eukprot:GSA120T00014736001.1